MVPEDRWHDFPDAQASIVGRQTLPWQAASRLAMGFLLLHLIFEYLRLHQILPILGMLKVQTGTFAALLFIVIAETGKRGVSQ